MCTILRIAFIALLSLKSFGQVYEVKKNIDLNGFTYETVSNDPVAMRTYTLKNGLKVFLSQNKDRSRVWYQVAVRAGSKHDPDNNTGLSHYLEHLLFNGTYKISSLNWETEKQLLDELERKLELYKVEADSIRRKQLLKQIDSLNYKSSKYSIKGEYRNLITELGGYGINGVTQLESTLYGCSIPANALYKLLLLEKERFLNPAFRLFLTELEIVYEEYNSLLDNDFWQFYLPANLALFNGHTYTKNTIGKAEHLSNPSLKSVKEYYSKYYVPNNMAIAITGNINLDSTILWVNNTFGTLLPNSKLNTQLNSKVELAPITSPINITVKSPAQEGVWLCYRMNGAGSEDEKCLSLLGELLQNNYAGLLKLRLLDTRKVGNVYSFHQFIHNDFSAHYFNIRPTKGQSLENAKNEVLKFIDRLKQGDFEDWLIKAAALSYKEEFIENITTSNNLETQANKAFISGRTWKEQLDFIQSLETITKKQLIEFIKRTYKDNYVSVYRSNEMGVNLGEKKVQNFSVTPIQLNDSRTSAFANNFRKIQELPTKPNFINYKKAIQQKKLLSGVDFVHVLNRENDLVELDIIFDIGRDHSRELEIAITYSQKLGTSKFTFEQLQKEFYKIGLRYSLRIERERTIFHLDGSAKNIEKGIEMLNHIIDGLAPDLEVYKNHVTSIVNTRNSNMKNRQQLSNALYNFALYEENSPTRDILSETQLRALQPSDLTKMVADLKRYKHRIYYYGNNPTYVFSALQKYYHSPKVKIDYPEKKTYPIIPSAGKIYFIHYEGAQSEVGIEMRSDLYNRDDMNVGSTFSLFIGNLVYAKIREQKSLAYNVGGVFLLGSDTSQYNYLELTNGVESEKTEDVLKTIHELLNSIDGSQSIFENTKMGNLKQYESIRTRGRDIFWKYEEFKKQNINEDPNQIAYNSLLNMNYNTIQSYFDKYVKGRPYNIIILGDRNKINLKNIEKYGELKELNINYLFNY